MRRLPARAAMAGLGLFALRLAPALPAGAVEIFEPRDPGSRYERYAVPEDDLYKSPIQLLASADGRRLYVACEGTDEVLVVDTRRREVVGGIAVGRLPFGLALSADQRTLWVSNREEHSVSRVDLGAMREVGRVEVGDDPHAVVVSADGSTLFVTNLGTNDLSVVDIATGAEIRRLPMGQAPFDLALAPDGRSLWASNQYSNPYPFRTPSVLELTGIDPERRIVVDRREIRSTVVGQGVAVSPDGNFVAVALESPKNLIPQTQIYQGWMVTYGFALAETRPHGRTAQLLIDEPNLYFADPYGIAFTPDGRLWISSSGADAVTVVDMEKVAAVLELEGGRIGVDDATLERYGRHLALSNEYVLARIGTGSNPKDVAVSPDGRTVYVADRLSDQITVIDARKLAPSGVIPLGGPQAITTLRRGARLFNYSSISFQHQLSCATCHPEEHVDGLSYDIAVDGGMGRNLVDNMTMRGVAETAPFKWSGKNPTLQRQEGPRAAQLFFRTHGFDDDEREAISRFIESIPLRPNRFRHDGQPLDEFQLLGRRIFERVYDNTGVYIPIANRCATCHPPPFGTDRRKHDIGGKGYHDWDGLFDTPHITNVYQKGPFLHDGRSSTLEEIWTVFNPDDTHGRTNDLTKDQLNALIEYLKTY